MHQTALNMSAAELSLHKTFTSMTESEGKAAGTDELISFIDFCLITAKNTVISMLLHLFLLPLHCSSRFSFPVFPPHPSACYFSFPSNLRLMCRQAGCSLTRSE